MYVDVDVVRTLMEKLNRNYETRRALFIGLVWFGCRVVWNDSRRSSTNSVRFRILNVCELSSVSVQNSPFPFIIYILVADQCSMTRKQKFIDNKKDNSKIGTRLMESRTGKDHLGKIAECMEQCTESMCLVRLELSAKLCIQVCSILHFGRGRRTKNGVNSQKTKKKPTKLKAKINNSPK